MKHLTRIVTSLIAVVLLSGMLISSAVAQEDTESVTLCHATGSENNPFVEITVDASGAFNGHLGVGHQNGEDIIPPFFYQGSEYSQNYDAEGQAILANGCDIPDVEPTAVPTEEPTAVPTEEPTAVPTEEPTAVPTEEPTAVPTTPGEPTVVPTTPGEPTVVPTTPTVVPTKPVNELPVTGSGVQDDTDAGYLMLAGALLTVVVAISVIGVKRR